MTPPLTAVTVRAMTPVVKVIYLVVLGLWVGSIIFFSFVVAPTVFKVLPATEAARLQRALFPRYYLVGMVCAAAGIVCVGLMLARAALPVWPGILSLLLLAVCGATNFWLRQAVVPHMAELREQRAAARTAGQEPAADLEREWQALHRLSVQLNLGVLVCGLVLLVVLVYSRAV